MYRSLGASVWEFLWLAGRSRPEELSDIAYVDEQAAAAVEAALARGRGVVFAASHTGNWDLAACAIARRVPLLVVTKRLHSPGFDAFWQATRRRFGVRLTGATGAMARARGQLGAGGAVAMMIDQVPDRRLHGRQLSFLGAEAWVDRAPAAMAARSGATLLVTASCRMPDGRHRLTVLRALAPPDRGAVHAASNWISDATAEATRALEGFVREHPESWLWLHRRWKALDA